MNVTFRRLLPSLPLFEAASAAGDLYYAPGRLTAVPPSQRASFRRALMAGSDAPGEPEASALLRAAVSAQRRYEALMNRPYAPLCLTVYLHNDCGLACAYCFSRPARGAGGRVSLEAVAQAADRVARHCQAARQPMTYVCHGGGEPLLNRPLAEAALATVEQIAAAHGLSLFRYVATSGMLSARTARWAADRFDLIGLSCDGPPDIHDRQRRTAGDRPTSAFVERTAAMWRAAGRPFNVRVTVTPDACARLGEIATYLSQVIGPREIYAEPVYGPAASPWESCPELVDAFITGHLDAITAAAAHGIPWRVSLIRPGAVHTAHCHVFRDVLHLLPDGALTGCFLTCIGDEAQRQGLSLGHAGDDPADEDDRPRQLRTRLGRLPTVCAACPNGYHCARACPDQCLATGDPDPNSFRCRLSRGLLNSRLSLEAEKLRAGAAFGAGRVAATTINEV